MRVTEVRFLGAAAAPGGEPRAGLPEIAIAGRSNVGKSSLINAFLGRRRGIARTSGTPGRTRQINFFVVNERFVLADLPGYGFAVGSDAERRAWGPLVETYLRDRPTLRGVVLLVDVRRGVEAEEDELLAFLAHVGVPVVLVATKTDKLAKTAAARAVAVLAGRTADASPVIGFSARPGAGCDALWRRVGAWVDGPPRGTTTT